jgi:hypothetical protein
MLKPISSSAHSTKMPRSRMKMSHRTPAGSASGRCAVVAAAAVDRVIGQPAAVTIFCGTVSTRPLAVGSACILTRVSNDCAMSAGNCSALTA